MIRLNRTDSSDPHFIDLVRDLDAELAIRDGEDHMFYSQFNTIQGLKHVVVAYIDGYPAGCGAIKPFDEATMEIKRMFVRADYRRMGIAGTVLGELEKWTLELSCKKCILETGLKQPEAIGLYKKTGYIPIPNYGQYEGVETSVCFIKELV
ncbi:MAG: GNAT family N-acetyltransferase [Bacteroidales bacterium]